MRAAGFSMKGEPEQIIVSYFARSEKQLLKNNEEKRIHYGQRNINVYKEKGYTSFDVVAKPVVSLNRKNRT